MLPHTILIIAAFVLPVISSPVAWGGGLAVRQWSGKDDRNDDWHGDDWNDDDWFDDGWDDDDHDRFTSTYSIVATPNQVVNGTTPTGGLRGAIGYYNFGINRHRNVICYHIRLRGFRGKYSSPAKTATHIHEAASGASGPPRIAFPNPRQIRGRNDRISSGCLRGPFTTGITDTKTGKDTGAGFRVGRIERNPKNFFADVHSSLALAGAVRGQLSRRMAINANVNINANLDDDLDDDSADGFDDDLDDDLDDN